MKTTPWLILGFTLAAQTALAGDEPIGFLERKDLPYPQDVPFEMEQTPAEVRAQNKQVVLDFYKVISDKREWTEENRKKYFHDDFIQHDPAEPNTSEAFFDFFRSGMGMGPPPEQSGDGEAPRPMMRMAGVASMDSNNSPVNWMVAEGDIVVVLRHRNWDWENGPVPVFNGLWVDVWRLEDGKIKEQWCTATPSDANLTKINQMLSEGKFPKNENWD